MNCSDRWLIILRGVPAVGKSSVAGYIRRKLGSQYVCRLNLDDLDPPPDFASALQYKFVIGELFSGKYRTEDPKEWIQLFREAGYRMLSIVLDVKYDVGLRRYEADPKRQNHPYWTKELYNYQYARFYSKSKFMDFANAASVREIRIDTNSLDAAAIADKLVSEIRKRGGGGD